MAINRNLLSKLKPQSLSSFSSDYLCRIFSKAAGTANSRQAHAPTVAGDLNRKSMFLIEHKVNGITNNTLLSFSGEWKHHYICSPSFPEGTGLFTVVGSCKELILLFSYGHHKDLMVVDEEDGVPFQQFQPRLILWNPITNRLKTLPPSLLPRPRRLPFIHIDCPAFGFDPKSQDYKVVCFLQYGDNKHISFVSPSPTYSAIEVYSLKTNSWKQITAPPPDIATPYFHLVTLHINGVHYWAGYAEVILSFDFANEKFYYISLPREPHIERMVQQICLAEFHGSLALIVPYWVPTEDLTEEEQQKQMQQPFSVEIWVWNGETWDVGPRVAVGDFPVVDDGIRALGLFQNEYLFLQGCYDTQLMLFNCKTGKLKNLGIHRDPYRKNTVITKPGVFSCTVPNC